MTEVAEALRSALATVSSNSVLSADLCRNPEAMAVAHALMEAMPIMIAIFDSDLRYIYANRRYVQFANPANPNWQGALIPEYLPSRTADEVMPRIMRVLNGERVTYHLDLVPSPGVLRTILVSYEPIPTIDNSTIYLMTGQDATDLKQAEQRLFATQKLETLGQLTGGIAHDFNNLIGIIVGNLSLLKLGTADAQKLDRLEKCRQAADRCAKLTSQLISFARRQPMKPRILAVKKQLETMEDLIRITVPSNIDIKIIDNTPGAALEVDQTQFESALMNLIINARDAMPQGGTITIEASIRKHSASGWTWDTTTKKGTAEGLEFVLIEVKDTGSGMPPDIASRAFEPFVTTKQEGAGSGMGLAMVYGFVTQCGGVVDLISTVGEGTTVRLFLPRARPQAEQTEPELAGVAPPAAGLNILVVEDDPDMAVVICEMLGEIGHTSRHCEDAATALELLSSDTSFDIVLTDIMLRGKMSGLELREKVLELHPGMRVICISGYQDQTAMQSYAAQPNIEFIGKPFDFDVLAAKIGNRPDVAS